MKNHHEVLIVGGGVIGHSISYYLNKSGLSATVMEKGESGHQTTRAAAGMLGVHTENKRSGEFYRFCKESRDLYKSLRQELYELTSIDIQLSSFGMLEVALNENEAQKLWEKQAAFSELEWLERAELKEKILSLPSKAVGALYMREDGHVESTRVCEAFKQAALQLGGGVLENCHVVTIQKAKATFILTTNKGSFTADQVVIATGADSERWFTTFDLPNPMVPIKGECFSIKPKKREIKATLFFDDFYLVPKLDGRYIIGATSVPNDQTSDTSAGGIFELMQRLFSVFPNLQREALLSVWSGIRPGTKDGLPIIGEHPNYSGLVYATGHYRNGVLLAPATGKLVKELMIDKRASTPVLGLISPERIIYQQVL